MSYLLVQANALRIPLADGSVQCCVTSPPYWGLRDYGVTGQLGLEATPDEFVAKMVSVFREVKRVLREDGTCWVNMGDSYARMQEENVPQTKNRACVPPGMTGRIKNAGLKPKDLVGIPWRLAFALQADGWYLRSDIIWAKPNPMPESVTDRPTKSHEYMFLLSKSERYYFDAEAVREIGVSPEMKPEEYRARLDHTSEAWYQRTNGRREADGYKSGNRKGGFTPPGGRNIRSVWSIPTESYPGSHFATYPRKLVEPCIKAGTSEKGCCPVCGAGWVREVESERVATRPGEVSKSYNVAGFRGNSTRYTCQPTVMPNSEIVGNRDPGRHVTTKVTTGWRPACDHDAPPVPCVVLDPFSGSATTGVVALALGRRFVGLELNADYLELATQRISRPHARVPRPGKPENHPLFGEGA